MSRIAANSHSQRRLWSWIVVILLCLGVLFRVSYLDRPVYWVDEVATSMRVSGYTHADVREQVATGLPVTVADLQTFQMIRGDRPRSDLSRVLTQSPEHAPLYFVLARFWAEALGGSVVVMRSLPVLFGLLAFPAMYGLGRALFQKHQGRHLIGLSAMGLLAISPFFVAYSQEARPYSLWILLLLLVSQFLARSLQSNRWQWWLSYALSLILCLYTSLLTVLVVFGQGLAVIAFHPKRRLSYTIVTGASLVALLPWVVVVFTHWTKLQSNTVWMQVPTTIWAILGTWFYSLAVLFFDVPVAVNPVLFVMEVVAATLTLAVIGYAFYHLIRSAPRSVIGFFLAGTFSIPLMLLLIDIVRDGQAAATPRYLMPTHIGALVATAYLIGDRLFAANNLTGNQTAKLSTKQWNSAIALLLSVSLLSCIIGLNKDSPYLKSRNLSNAGIIAELNNVQFVQLVTTPYYIQDVISLSYRLNPDISIYFLPEKSDPGELLTKVVSLNKPTFLFTPSEELKAVVKENQFGNLRSVFEPAPLISGDYGLTLWRLES